jgi:hypothetical protein
MTQQKYPPLRIDFEGNDVKDSDVGLLVGTLRTSPAMAAGVTDQLWSVEDLVALWESYEQRRAERAA